EKRGHRPEARHDAVDPPDVLSRERVTACSAIRCLAGGVEWVIRDGKDGRRWAAGVRVAHQAHLDVLDPAAWDADPDAVGRPELICERGRDRSLADQPR